MSYQLLFFIVSSICVGMVIIMYFREMELKDWRTEYRRLVTEYAKFTMMNKNETAYFEATKEEMVVGTEKQKEAEELREKQRIHDKVFLTGVITEDEEELLGTGEGVIQ